MIRNITIDLEHLYCTSYIFSERDFEGDKYNISLDE